MKLFSIIFTSFSIGASFCVAQPKTPDFEPLTVAQHIGDKLIGETDFNYQVKINKDRPIFDGIQHIDFKRTFGSSPNTVAYAFTQLNAPSDMDLKLELEHNDGCKIWLNGQLIYTKYMAVLKLQRDERSTVMHNECLLKLRKGVNSLLIKSASNAEKWAVYMQLPATKGSVDAPLVYPSIGLKTLKYVDSSVFKLSNWLVIGPFGTNSKASTVAPIDSVYPPESEFVLGRMYKGANNTDVTWTLPKVEILGSLVNPQPWGSNYSWCYNNGGVAWAMEELSEASGKSKYNDYAAAYCDFHLNGIPFVNYQVGTLGADSCDNNQIIEPKLLDFTLAPSLPIIYRLCKSEHFTNRDKYVAFIEKMINYAQFGQLRDPKLHMYTRTTPVKYTTWVDDMYMGIPFLVQASIYTSDQHQKEILIEDAASQVIGFSNQVWDAQSNLFMHAKISGDDKKFPHWSRANGWGIWAMSEVLMHLPKNSPNYQAVFDLYQKHAASLIKLQDARGFWLNVLDRPDSREEVSGTAIFTMCLARGINNGWLDRKIYLPFVMNGWHALQRQVDSDGTVHNICVGSMCSKNVDYYMNRPLLDNDTHGLLAVLFACLEMDKILKKGNTP